MTASTKSRFATWIAIPVLVATVICGTATATQASASSSTLNPEVAAAWARTHAMDPPTFGADCTYFVSRALYHGGLDETSRWNFDSSDPENVGGGRFGAFTRPTATATVADKLTDYLVKEAKVATKIPLNWRKNEVPQASVGDLIAYDWDNGADGTIDHLSMITGFSAKNGQYPLVSQHTPEQRDRGWTWAASDGTWIESARPGAKVFLIHFR